MVGAGLPLAERVRRLGVGIDAPIAFFSGGGDLMDATPAAEARLLGLKSLAALGADTLAGEALVAGRASGTSHLGPITLERIGADASIVLLASFPQAAQALAPEPVADATPAPAKEQSAPAAIEPGRLPPATPMLPVEPQPAEPLPPPSKTPVERRQSLRFVWQMDADGRLTIGTEEFATAIGPQAAATLSRPWREIATDLNLDRTVRLSAPSRRATPGATSQSPSRSTAPSSACRSNCRAFRCSIASATCSATAASVSAAMPQCSPPWSVSATETLRQHSPTPRRPGPKRPQPTRPRRAIPAAARAAGVPRGTPCPVRGAADRERLAVPLLGAGREIAKPDAGRAQDVQRARQHAVGAAARSAQSRQQSHTARTRRSRAAGAASSRTARRTAQTASRRHGRQRPAPDPRPPAARRPGLPARPADLRQSRVPGLDRLRRASTR